MATDHSAWRVHWQSVEPRKLVWAWKPGGGTAHLAQFGLVNNSWYANPGDDDQPIEPLCGEPSFMREEHDFWHSDYRAEDRCTDCILHAFAFHPQLL